MHQNYGEGDLVLSSIKPIKNLIYHLKSSVWVYASPSLIPGNQILRVDFADLTSCKFAYCRE